MGEGELCDGDGTSPPREGLLVSGGVGRHECDGENVIAPFRLML